MTAESRQVFLLRIAAAPGAAGLRDLRNFLKQILRRHHLICIDAREVPYSNQQTGPGASAQRSSMTHTVPTTGE
jgi:hypothetical protein